MAIKIKTESFIFHIEITSINNGKSDWDQLNPIAKTNESGVILERYVYGLKSNIPEYLIKSTKQYRIISNHTRNDHA